MPKMSKLVTGEYKQGMSQESDSFSGTEIMSEAIEESIVVHKHKFRPNLPKLG